MFGVESVNELLDVITAVAPESSVTAIVKPVVVFTVTPVFVPKLFELWTVCTSEIADEVLEFARFP